MLFNDFPMTVSNDLVMGGLRERTERRVIDGAVMERYIGIVVDGCIVGEDIPFAGSVSNSFLPRSYCIFLCCDVMHMYLLCLFLYHMNRGS